ncbi:MAG: isoprenylcysteine carboxylmethyltransferase family protein [Anaerolineales bacterium]|nr:isoprenylcysteine carboxylmethyltransferase family protein [Anaerolineales bacterium]
MGAKTVPHPPNPKAEVTAGIIRRLAQVIVGTLLQAMILFLSAGRLAWGMAWAYLGVYIGVIVVTMMVLLKISPELIAERAQLRADAKSWDKPLAAIISLFGPLVILLVAGLDERFGWSPPFIPTLQLAALIGMALGYALGGWAMASNKFFSGLVRIQTERQHTVATGGPYRYIRHPGYSGWLLAYLVTPLVLGSLCALLPAGLTAVVIVIRTLLEDRTLQAELEGYQAYAHQVRYRLLPGIW